MNLKLNVSVLLSLFLIFFIQGNAKGKEESKNNINFEKLKIYTEIGFKYFMFF